MSAHKPVPVCECGHPISLHEWGDEGPVHCSVEFCECQQFKLDPTQPEYIL